MKSTKLPKTRILHVISSMDPTLGGPIQGVHNYVEECFKHSMKNEVVCLDEPHKSFIREQNIVVHALGPANNCWSYSNKLRPWLKQHLHRFDVVLIHGLWLYNGYAVMKEMEALKKQQSYPIHFPKVFVMPHGMLDPYFQQAPERKLKAIRNSIYWQFIESKVVNRANGVLFTCKEELLLARKTFNNYHPNKEYNILYGIANPPPFNVAMNEVLHQQCPSLAKRPYLLFLSRIHQKKGIESLIQAYAEVYVNNTGISGESKAPNFPLLVIAGPGLNTPYGKKLQQLIERLHLHDLVVFPGMISGDAKWAAFYGCDCFVLPSHQENFSIAVAEALACSKPVLISKKINIWREINNCNAGLMEDDTLEGTISLLLNWKNLSEGEKFIMKENARNCYENNFAIGPATIRMLKVFHEVASEPSKGILSNKVNLSSYQ